MERQTLPRPPALEPLHNAERSAVRVAEEDPSLLGSLTGELADAARHQLVARTHWRDPGRWAPLGGVDVPRRFDGWLGLLVLDGLVVRQVSVDGLRCCELLGPGDVLRPWDEDDGAATLDLTADWRVLEPTRVAQLDSAFARQASRWPTVHAELMQRSVRRSRSLSVLLALTQARRADVRLRTLFWHLADRWGRVTPDGVVLPLRLTHSVIAQLTGLRRPSVSLSLGELERTGEIVRLSRSSWLLSRNAGAVRAA
ncbi:MAG TPA: Crp/Fnr family transcriptional regulator [Solirubrobacter sp.]|nr:Crp/Fnr family transcriptional regulator [Solirubrobacter sp.]